MKTKQAINAADLQKWVSHSRKLFATNYNDTEIIRLYCNLSGVFELEVNRVKVWEGLLVQDAVNEFNKY